MTTVFAQMERDRVGPAQFGLDRGPDRIGFVRLPGLANGCDMVNIDAQLRHGSDLVFG
jgi:hypothetical protein